MSKIGKKIPCRSCLTEAILVIGKKNLPNVACMYVVCTVCMFVC